MTSARIDDEDLHLDQQQHRRRLLRLLLILTAYYVGVAALLALLLTAFPDLVDRLPVGGVHEVAGQAADPVLEGVPGADRAAGDAATPPLAEPQWIAGALSLFTAMSACLVLMLPVSWVYKTIHDDNVYDHSLDETALVLPPVVAGIVLIVQHSLALAFSLAGIVAGVRFRRALSDTFDTLFIFVAIGVGIAAGIESIEIAAVLSVFFSYATVVVCAFGDGLESRYLANRKRLRKARKAAKRAAAIE